jgi:hypothetical protein
MNRPTLKLWGDQLLRECEHTVTLCFAPFGTSDLAQWEHLLAYLKASYPVRYDINGEPAIMPDDIQEAFQTIPGKRYMTLKVFVGGVTLILRFSSPNDICFYFDPCQVKTEDEVLSIFTIVEALARITSQRILGYPEGMPSGRRFLYEPETDSYS